MKCVYYTARIWGIVRSAPVYLPKNTLYKHISNKQKPSPLPAYLQFCLKARGKIFPFCGLRPPLVPGNAWQGGMFFFDRLTKRFFSESKKKSLIRKGGIPRIARGHAGRIQKNRVP